MVEVGCQTEVTAAAPPLVPACYPANLTFAQSMLAISIAQQKQVDSIVETLRTYLREYEAPAVHVENLSIPASTTAEDEVAPGINETPADTPDAQPQQQQADQLRIHRRRLAAAVKVALVMLLQEVRMGWFFLYFFAIFLYIGGLFDPLIEWFQHYSTQATLDQQLNALRNRQRSAAAAQPVATPRSWREPQTQPPRPAGDRPASPADADPMPTNSCQAPEVQQISPDNRPPVRSPDAEGAAATTSTSVSSSGGNGSGLDLGAATGDSDARRSTAAAGAAAAEGHPGQEGDTPAADRPGYAQQFFYQLVVMFFMTLIPWWNPDPRYL